MQLTKYTDYALRVLLILGQNQDKRITIDDITRHYHISRNHLMKIVHSLSVAGFINSTRGRSGGLMLGMAPEKITIADVVRHTEKNMALVECFATGSTCTVDPDCVIKHILYRAQDNFMDVLSIFTLADILDRQNLLAARQVEEIEQPINFPADPGIANH